MASDSVEDLPLAGAEHVPVMLAPVLQHLQLRADGHYLDLTFGRGGYARAMLERLGPDGRLTVVDQDPEAVAAARTWAATDSRIAVLHANFADAVTAAAAQATAYDGIVADLGVSSPQIDNPERGFSFMRDGPLDMRMDLSQGVTAAQWLAEASVGDMIRVLRQYGDEPDARRIALAIARARDQQPLERTAQLARVIEEAVGGRRGRRIHPATRSFQALRMVINDEMGALERMLAAAHGALVPDGVLVVVSFHSLEDRQVKRMLQQGARPRAAHPALPDPTPQWRAIGRELCSEIEAQRNPRSRSAVLRWGRTWAGEA
ncbi:MAG: 16S rRNA (cytosine(1402)-N(4))-methyltransferase RsmH [Oceanococcaceae bacterium]